MAVSKRVRYEVLRRDNHACRYCGGAAPDVVLTVDHVIPVALGGSDDPSNLVAACGDCNAGKSSVAPDSPIVADVDRRALVWARAMEQAAAERAADHERLRAVGDQFREAWDGWTWTDKLGEKHQITIDGSWRSSIEQFVAAGLPLAELVSLIEVAMCANTTDEWRYFCGCAWRRIRQAQERAVEIVSEMEMSPATADQIAGQARLADLLEQELIELQAERRRREQQGGPDHDNT